MKRNSAVLASDGEGRAVLLPGIPKSLKNGRFMSKIVVVKLGQMCYLIVTTDDQQGVKTVRQFFVLSILAVRQIFRR